MKCFTLVEFFSSSGKGPPNGLNGNGETWLALTDDWVEFLISELNAWVMLPLLYGTFPLSGREGKLAGRWKFSSEPDGPRNFGRASMGLLTLSLRPPGLRFRLLGSGVGIDEEG